jgi:hypothetical protein
MISRGRSLCTFHGCQRIPYLLDPAVHILYAENEHPGIHPFKNRFHLHHLVQLRFLASFLDIDHFERESDNCDGIGFELSRDTDDIREKY